MVIRLNQKNCKKLIYFQLIFVLCVYFFISIFHFPSMLTYVTDVVNIILLFCMFRIKSINLNCVGGKYIKISIGLFLGSLVIGCILNLVSPILIIWGARNLLRGFVFFVACVKFLDAEDVDKIFKIFFFAQIINFIVTLYQYFIVGIEQDYLGGIFGTNQGCNGATNIFFIILLTYVSVNYISKNIPIHIFALVAFSTLIIAALAEIKIYYIEFIVIIALAILFTKPSFRTFLAVGLTFAGLIAAINILKNIFPLQYETLVNVELLKEYADARSGGYNISRMNAFSDINRLFFHDNIVLKLFGYGLGGCEMSSFSFLISDFFKKYGAYNYRWFAHEMIYLQNGIVGIILFINYFIQIFIHAFKKKRIFYNDKKVINYATITQIFSILVIVNIWYNQTITTDFQYLIYVVLASFLIQFKTKKYSENA